jgi:diguanylate cyclase (GGDEF)-like protein/PAS domain S-box-containing protein
MMQAGAQAGGEKTSAPPRQQLLVVDDEPQVLVALSDLLSDDYIVLTADSPLSAFSVLEHEPDVAVVVSDQRMPSMNGDEFLGKLSSRSDATRMLVTGYADLSAVISAVNNGKIFAYVTKPWNPAELRMTIQQGVERFQLLRELARERQFLHDLMNNVPDAIYFKDRELTFSRVNPAFAELSGTADPADVVGKTWTQLDADAGVRLIEDQERQVLAEGRSQSDVVRERVTSNGKRWFSSTVAPIRSASGTVLGLVGISRDVTKRVATENALKASEERLRLTFDASNAGLFEWTIDSGHVHYSASIAALLGQEQSELTPSFDEFESRLHPADKQRVVEAIRRHLAERVPYNTEFRARVAGGDYRWFQSSGQAVWTPEGVPTRMVGSIHDITERKEQEQRIARLTRIRAMLGGVNAAIVRLSERASLLEECCRSAVVDGGLALALIATADDKSSPLSIAAFAGGNAELARSIGEELTQGVAAPGSVVDRLLRTEQAVVLHDVAEHTELAFARALLDAGCRAAAFLPLVSAGMAEGVFVLVAEEAGFFDGQEVRLLSELADNVAFALDHVAKSERLRFLAYYDELTGLPKRDLLVDRLSQWLHARLKDGGRLALLLVDISRFRHVNETLGRRAGDELLVNVTERLKKMLGEEDTLARFDSNGFGLLLPAAGDESEIASWVERTLVRGLNPCFMVSETELRIAVRVGVAVYPADGKDGDTLIANAEAALKAAKAKGSPCEFYAPSMNERVAEKLTLETKLRRAIEQEEFLLHYQPKIDLKTGLIVGLEALIRWQDPTRGLIAPGSFIPVLEETGLILDVGAWVLNRAAAQYAEWAGAGLSPPRIAVNVSAIQLSQRAFVASVDQALARHPAASGGLDIEITESVLMEDFGGSIEKLGALKKKGVCIAIDDFGTGYSSLGYLSRLPIDALKVDRSFIVRMSEDPQEMTIVSTIISLAHSLDLKVIAEGVETNDQARLLRLLKCDQIQGYLVGRPEAPEVTRQLLETHLDPK